MPYKTHWLEEHHTLYIDLRGVYTLSDLQNMLDENLSYIDRVPYKVHTILDARKVERIQFSIHEVNQTRMPPIRNNTGWNLTITDNQLFFFIASTITQLLKNAQFKNSLTLENALEFLASVEPLAQTLTVDKINALADHWEADTPPKKD
ncbi:MAG: hypothetical protein ACOYLB_01500 [Phototrophicaceae bacterium]